MASNKSPQNLSENPVCVDGSSYDMETPDDEDNQDSGPTSLVASSGDTSYVLSEQAPSQGAQLSYLQNQSSHCYPSLSLYPSGPQSVSYPSSSSALPTAFPSNNRCVSAIINTGSGVIIRTPHIPVYYLQQQQHQQHLQNSLVFQQHHQQKYLQESPRNAIGYENCTTGHPLLQQTDSASSTGVRRENHQESVFTTQLELSQHQPQLHIQPQEIVLQQRQSLSGATESLVDNHTCGNDENHASNVNLDDCDARTRDPCDDCDDESDVENKKQREFSDSNCNFQINVDKPDWTESNEIHDSPSTSINSVHDDLSTNVEPRRKENEDVLVKNCFICNELIGRLISYEPNLKCANNYNSEINPTKVHQSLPTDINYGERHHIISSESSADTNIPILQHSSPLITESAHISTNGNTRGVLQGINLNSTILTTSKTQSGILLARILALEVTALSSIKSKPKDDVASPKDHSIKTNLSSTSCIDGGNTKTNAISDATRNLSTRGHLHKHSQTEGATSPILFERRTIINCEMSQGYENSKNDGRISDDGERVDLTVHRTVDHNDKLNNKQTSYISRVEGRGVDVNNSENNNTDASISEGETVPFSVKSNNHIDKNFSNVACYPCWQLLEKVDLLEHQLSITKNTIIQKYTNTKSWQAKEIEGIKENLHPSEKDVEIAEELEEKLRNCSTKRKAKIAISKKCSFNKRGRVSLEQKLLASEQPSEQSNASSKHGICDVASQDSAEPQRQEKRTGAASNADNASESEDLLLSDENVWSENDPDDPDFPKKNKLTPKKKKPKKLDDAQNDNVDAFLEYIDSKRLSSTGRGSRRRDKKDQKKVAVTKRKVKSSSTATAAAAVEQEPGARACPQCHQVVEPRNFPRHLHRHKLAPCPLCPACYTVSELKMHLLRAHHSERLFPCPECDASFSSYKPHRLHYLEQHVGIAHSRHVICKLCRAEFSNASAARRHLQTIHLKTNSYACDKCQETFSQKGNLENHMKRIHEKGAKNCVCEVCDRRFAFPCDVREHLEKVHLNYRKKSAVCDVCGKSFADLRAVKTHINSVHTKDIEYPCPYCKMVFHSRTNMTSHKRRMHEASSRKYKCDICIKGFCNPSSLRLHKQIVHEKLIRYTCDICQQGFKIQSQLKYHRRKHTGECPYQCPHCYKSFPGPSHISSHVKKVHKTIYIGANQKRKLRLPEDAPPPPPGILISRDHQVATVMRETANSDVEIAIDVGRTSDMNSEEERPSDMRLDPTGGIADPTNLLHLSSTGVVDSSLHHARPEAVVHPSVHHPMTAATVNTLHHSRPEAGTNSISNHHPLHNHQHLVLHHHQQSHLHQQQPQQNPHHHLHLSSQHLQQNLHFSHQLPHMENLEASSVMNHHYVIQPNQVSTMVVGGSGNGGTGGSLASSGMEAEGSYPNTHYPLLQQQGHHPSVQPTQTMPMVVRVVHDMQYGTN